MVLRCTLLWLHSDYTPSPWYSAPVHQSACVPVHTGTAATSSRHTLPPISLLVSADHSPGKVVSTNRDCCLPPWESAVIVVAWLHGKNFKQPKVSNMCLLRLLVLIDACSHWLHLWQSWWLAYGGMEQDVDTNQTNLKVHFNLHLDKKCLKSSVMKQKVQDSFYICVSFLFVQTVYPLKSTSWKGPRQQESFLLRLTITVCGVHLTD